MDRKDQDSRGVGLKITSAQREYYRYRGVAAEVQRRGLPDQPGRDFSRLPRRAERSNDRASALPT
jgi:hypothetical protein